AAGERLGWDVVLKATAERLRQRPDQAHVWRSIDDEAEMRDAWESLMGIISHPDDAEFVVQRTAAPGVPVAIRGLEDPLFGPAVSFGISGALTDLVGDRVYRIPPISALDAAEMVRAIKAAPLLFGYRGSEQVDVRAVEELIRRVAQLKIDLPQLSQLDMMLVHATVDGVSVLHATGRVDPMAEPRSDLFVRRLTNPLDDTLHG
ncbi:MAG: CoA-binding domain protein, partial [Marmoricola sp.]|nr:CoA-binding domain protein [Marmoricola sp.]